VILVGVVPANPAAVARVRTLLSSAPHVAVAAMPPEALAAAGPSVSVLVLVDEVSAADRAAVLAAYAGRLRPPGLLLVRSPSAPQDDLPALLRLAGVGLVEEDAPGAEAVAAVEALARGGFYLSALYQFRWKECFLSAVTARVQPPPATLTAREQEVLAELAEGKSNADIARALFIGLNTVDTHLMSIFRKLGVHNRTEAVAMVLRGGSAPRDPALAGPAVAPARRTAAVGRPRPTGLPGARAARPGPVRRGPQPGSPLAPVPAEPLGADGREAL
jgi:DNA-binding NarL/FixJ family response regulator